MVKDRPAQFAVTHVLDDPPKSWAGPKGHLTADSLKELLPPAELCVLLTLHRLLTAC